MLKKILIIAGAFFVALSFAVQPTAEKKEEKYREIEVQADQTKYKYKDKIALLSGNIIITDPKEKATLYADKVEYDEEKETAKATGNLKFKDPEHTITGNLIFIEFKLKKATIEGKVIIVMEKKKEEKKETPVKAEGEAKEKPKEEKKLKQYLEEKTTITCQKIEYLYKDKKATVFGPLQIIQKDKKAYGEKATYSGKDEIVVITGNVSWEDEKGQKFSAPKITMCLKEDAEWIEAEGPAKGILKVKEEEEEKETAKTEKPEEEKK